MKTTKPNPDTLNALYAVGGSVAKAFAEVIPEEEWEDCAAVLLDLLNQIEASKPLPELREVVLGAMRAIGFEPKK